MVEKLIESFMQRHQLKTVDQFDDIHTKFKNVYSREILDDFSRIAQTLNDTTVIEFHLERLEKEIENRLTALNKINKTTKGMEVIKKTNFSFTSHYHVLTNFIAEWAQQNGFNQAHTVYCIEKDDMGQKHRIAIELPAKVPTIFDFLDGRIFISIILRLGYLQKDVGAGVSHGEFTHFLQLYILFEENKKDPFLRHSLSYLISISGDFTDYLGQNTLWSFIFDKDPDSLGFSNPDFFNADLTNVDATNNNRQVIRKLNVDKFPLLSQLLQGRADKREPEYRITPLKFYAPPTPEAELVQKYRQKSGLILNDSIFFETLDSPSRSVVYDDISRELEIYKKIVGDPNPSLLPPLDPNKPFLEQCLDVFNLNHYDKKYRRELNYAFSRMRDKLQEILIDLKFPGEILHHRSLILAMSELITKSYPMQPLSHEALRYFNAAFAFVLRGLETLDKKFEVSPTLKK